MNTVLPPVQPNTSSGPHTVYNRVRWAGRCHADAFSENGVAALILADQKVIRDLPPTEWFRRFLSDDRVERRRAVGEMVAPKTDPWGGLRLWSASNKLAMHGFNNQSAPSTSALVFTRRLLDRVFGPITAAGVKAGVERGLVVTDPAHYEDTFGREADLNKRAATARVARDARQVFEFAHEMACKPDRLDVMWRLPDRPLGLGTFDTATHIGLNQGRPKTGVPRVRTSVARAGLFMLLTAVSAFFGRLRNQVSALAAGGRPPIGDAVRRLRHQITTLAKWLYHLARNVVAVVVAAVGGKRGGGTGWTRTGSL